ncbi:MAG: hypothetical protein ACLQMF_00385 [Rectinemataceae bacterium]
MRQKRTRALTWTLVGLGIAILVLGTTLALTMPSTGPFPGPWLDRGGEGFAPWGRFAVGQGYGGMWMGMHMVGGVILFIIIVFAVLALLRRRNFRQGRFGEHAHEGDAITLLRIEFAEGRISEAEYRERLAVLKE